MREEVEEISSDILRQKISGMKDILVYHYFDVDLNLKWGVVMEDIPTLKKNVLRVLSELAMKKSKEENYDKFLLSTGYQFS